MAWRIVGKAIEFDDGTMVPFNGNIAKAVEQDDTIVVRLINEVDSELLNVFGVRNRRVVWRIKERSDACGAYVGPEMLGLR